MITKGLEDYLEIIYNAISENKDIKAIDIANELKVSRPSVSEALIRLADSDLIVYEGRKGIKITERGKKEALKIIRKHNTLLEFFTEILKINFEEANQNACKIEHVVDDNVIAQIKKFTEFCQKNNIHRNFH